MVRLIPRDEKFFDLFTQDGETILEAARKLEAMVASYDRLDERVAEIQALEKQGDQIDRRSACASSAASSRRSTARTSTSSRSTSTTSSTGSRRPRRSS